MSRVAINLRRTCASTLAALVGVVAGLVLGGRLAILADVHLRAPVLVWVALNAAVQRAAMRFAFGLLAAGWLLNLVVMIPNGGMPVSATALSDSGEPAGFDVEEGHLRKHVDLSPSTVLPGLGDVVAVPALGSAVSAGDLVMVVGVAMAWQRSWRVCDADTPLTRRTSAGPASRDGVVDP